MTFANNRKTENGHSTISQNAIRLFYPDRNTWFVLALFALMLVGFFILSAYGNAKDYGVGLLLYFVAIILYLI